MSFTSWSALKTAILDAIAGGNIMTQSYSINGKNHQFRSLKEAMEFIQFCDMQIAASGGGMTAYAEFKRPEVSE